MPTHLNVAIIGAGTAGLTARRAAKKAGASAVCMFDSGPLGTTCARVGCMPSKLLIAAAESAHHSRHGSVFGVDVPEVNVDGKRVMERVQKERDRFTGFVKKSISNSEANGEFIPGHVHITGKNSFTSTVDGIVSEFTFDSLILASGTTPFVPPPYDCKWERVVTSDQIFELETLPESLLVVGTGVIALELGQAMSRLGVDTDIIGIDENVAFLRDPKVASVAREVLTDELDLHFSARAESAKEVENGVEVTITKKDGTSYVKTFEYVLVAAGRRSQLPKLGLEKMGIELDRRGYVEVNPLTMQVADFPVFIAGDANGLHPLLHEAADDGYTAGTNAATYPEVESFPRRAPLGVVFTDPQIAIVGAAFQSLDQCGAVIGSIDYSAQGRSRVMDKNKGWVNVYAELGSGKLLGAEMFGPSVEHTAHLLAWCVQQELTVAQILKMPFYHPVVEEGIRTALRDALAHVENREVINPDCDQYGPGI